MATEILSADDARNLMKEAIMDCDLEYVMRNIYKKAKQGKSSLSLAFSLTSEVKTKLLELGYKVSNKYIIVDTIYWTI